MSLRGKKAFSIIIEFMLIIGMLFPINFWPISTEKVKADTDYTTQLSTCSFSVGSSPSSGGATLTAVTTDNNGKTLTFSVNISGSAKTYKFTYDSALEANVDSLGDPGVLFRYNGPVSGTILTLSTKKVNNNVALEYEGFYLASAEKGDSDYQKFANLINSTSNPATNDLTPSAAVKGVCSTSSDVFGSGNYDTQIDFHGDDPPTITIGGRNASNGASARPPMIFELRQVINKAGEGTLDDILFLFVYDRDKDGDPETQYQNYLIKFFPNNHAFFAKCSNVKDYTTCDDQGGAKVVIPQDNALLFFNHVFNSKNTGDGDGTCSKPTTFASADKNNPKNDKNLANWTTMDTPALKCLNQKDDGWLAHWGLSTINGSASDPTGTNDGECGSANYHINLAIIVSLCNMVIGFRDIAKSFMCWAAGQFIAVIGTQSVSYQKPSACGSTSAPSGMPSSLQGNISD